MTVGGANDTSKIGVSSPLGWERARDLIWLSERYVLLPESSFSNLARWELAAAKSLGLPTQPVACAWVATGVLEPAYVKKKWKAECTKNDR
jgi:hypothetical protein